MATDKTQEPRSYPLMVWEELKFPDLVFVLHMVEETNYPEDAEYIRELRKYVLQRSKAEMKEIIK